MNVSVSDVTFGFYKGRGEERDILELGNTQIYILTILHDLKVCFN